MTIMGRMKTKMEAHANDVIFIMIHGENCYFHYLCLPFLHFVFSVLDWVCSDDLDCIRNEMKQTHKYTREHNNTMKTQLLFMNKITEYCKTQTS